MGCSPAGISWLVIQGEGMPALRTRRPSERACTGWHCLHNGSQADCIFCFFVFCTAERSPAC